MDKGRKEKKGSWYKNYHSDKIKGIVYRKEVEMYGRVMYRNAVITLL